MCGCVGVCVCVCMCVCVYVCVCVLYVSLYATHQAQARSLIETSRNKRCRRYILHPIPYTLTPTPYPPTDNRQAYIFRRWEF